jgi:hypothetical protein
MVLLGLAFGLLVGIVEAGAIILMIAFVPGSVSWRSANGAEILIVAPPVNAVAFGVLALLVSAGRLFSRRIQWDVGYVALGGALAGYLGATMPGRILYWWAVDVLAIGCGALAVKLYRANRSWIQSHLVAIVAGLAAVPIAAAPVMLGTAWLRERRVLAARAPAPADRPNLLLLVVDTERADHLGLYGYERATSPALDSFGARGLVFQHATANSPWTLPSHATMMTGRLQHEHRAGLLRKPFLDRRWPTLAEALTGAGYATGGFVANTFWAGRRTGLDRGFVHFSDYYRNVADAVARTTIGRTVYYGILPRLGAIDIPGRRRAPELNGDLLRWIDGLGGRRFFAFVNYLDVHPPLLPPAPFRGRFARDAALPVTHEIDVGAITGEMHQVAPAVIADRLGRYDESILAWDDAFAGLLRELERRGLRDNTLIVVTADHGVRTATVCTATRSTFRSCCRGRPGFPPASGSAERWGSISSRRRSRRWPAFLRASFRGRRCSIRRRAPEW